MARQTTAQRHQDVHTEALTEFDRVQSSMRDVRIQCLQARRFYSIPGAQWEGPLGAQFENKPKFEFNKVHLSVIRVVNEWRNNRITVDFTPKDGASNSELADACDGLFRADEQDSGAQEAYDNAFEEGVGGGFGAARLRAEYEDDEDDENTQQRIRIEPIFDADTSVFFDLDAKRQDKADAKRCWVLSSMTHDSFKEQFGHDPSTWPKMDTNRFFDWKTPDVVYVAEYYRIEETTELIHVYRGLDDQDMFVPDHELKEDEGKADMLQATGFREVRQKRVKRRRVHKYILSGAQIEEDCGYIAGKCIPVVTFYGKRWFVDNIERCMGHVQLAMDAQRLQNSLLSWLTEIATRFDVEKPIFSPEQMLGHAEAWANDNVKRYPFLLANLVRDDAGAVVAAGPIGYTKAPNIPPAMAALVQIASQALEDLLGNQQAGEQIQPNISGKAVEMIQTRLDMQTFIYMSNMAKFCKRVGEVWLSMAKEVYVEDERHMKTVSHDGAIDSMTLNTPAINKETGEQYLQNDLDDAKFDVWVDVGPSSTSQKAATVRALTNMAQMTQDPETTQVLMSAAMMQIEGEGLDDIRAFFRNRLVKMGVIKPTDEEAQELAAAQQNTPPDPQAQYLMASAEQASADAAKSRAQTVDAIASADLKGAQRAKVLAETMGEHNSQQIASAQALHGMLYPPGSINPNAGA